jgi:uncharacterized membrane protein YfcA
MMAVESWMALPAAIMISTIVSTVGIGGGILWMPFFLIVFGLRPDTAVLSSLLIQTAGMGSGAMAYRRQNRVDSRLARFLLMVTVPGLITGAWLTRVLSPAHMEAILGLLTMATAFWFVSSNQKYEDIGNNRVEMSTAYRYSGAVAGMAVASGMLSVSIGEWLVPLMRNRMNLRMGHAVATSIATIFGTCLVGSAIHLLMGHRAEWSIVAWAVPGVLIGGQIGPRLTERIDDRVLKEVFIFLLTLIGIHLIYNSY